jgi:transcriptional regulator GlxA family with amidase domain
MKVKSKLKKLLELLRKNSDETLSLEEITEEVEAIRKTRYDIRQESKI